MSNCNIYGLYNELGEIRYVGKTIRSLEIRYSQHIRGATKSIGKPKVSHCFRWIQSMLAKGLKPTIKLIVVVPNDGEEAERFYIAYFKTLGAKLTNLTMGGEGALGYKHTESTRKIISEKRIGKKPWNKGLTKETDSSVKRNTESRKKFCDSHPDFLKGKNNPMYGKTQLNSPIFGRHYSKEHKRKLSIAKVGRKNPMSKIMNIKTPDGLTLNLVASEFIKEYGEKYKINKGFLYGVIRYGDNKNGWKVKYQ